MPDEEMTESMRQVMGLDGDRDRLEAFYDGWAAEYDADVASHGYGLPEMMVDALRRSLVAAGITGSPAAIVVLDAGCGTGLVGQALFDAGFTELRGADLSAEMADRARERGVYRTVTSGVDLTVPPSGDDVGAVDAVTVGGVFTVGHVPPAALATIAERVRPGGVLVVSTRRAYQDDTDFVAEQQRLVDDGRLELLVHVEDAPYTMDSTGDYWAWRVPT